MAYINILKGGFTQRLGTIYGVRSKYGNVVKVVPFSKAPPTDLQTSSVRAFEALNRISAGIAKKFWNYLGLKQGDMHRHNRVASWLSTCVSDHRFDPYKIANVIPSDGSVSISEFFVSNTESYGNVKITVQPPDPSLSGGGLFVMVFDSQGKKYLANTFTGLSLSIDFFGVFPSPMTFFAMAFRSDKTVKGFNVHGFSIRSFTIV